MQKRLFRMCVKGPRLHGPFADFRMKVSFQLSVLGLSFSFLLIYKLK